MNEIIKLIEGYLETRKSIKDNEYKELMDYASANGYYQFINDNEKLCELYLQLNATMPNTTITDGFRDLIADAVMYRMSVKRAADYYKKKKKNSMKRRGIRRHV